LVEKTVNSVPSEAHKRLMDLLLAKNCKVVESVPPYTVSTVQGSLWGTSAKSAKKRISFVLREAPQETIIYGASNLTSGYLFFAFIGVALSMALMIICIWVAVDLQTSVSNGVMSYWSWLSQINGFLDLNLASFYISLCWGLAVFLAVSILFEIIIVVRILSKVDVFAEEILKIL
jgi:hypothetical protein